MEVPAYSIPVYSVGGDQVDTMSIDASLLGEVINPALIKQAYVMYHANLRQGSARTRGRSYVSGSSKKIYKQKGTGRARHGGKRAPQFRGGGHYKMLRRTREDYRLTMPKKMRRQANRNALLAKVIDDELRVVDTIAFEKPRTKDVSGMLAALKVDGSALLALSADPARSGATRLGARNVDGLTLCRADSLNCFDMLNHRYLVIERGELEAWLAGPSGQTDKAAKLEPMGAARASGGREARKPRPKRGAAVKQALRETKLAAKAGEPAKAEG